MGMAGGEKVLLWKGFPRELVGDQALGGATGAAEHQTAGAGAEAGAANDEG